MKERERETERKREIREWASNRKAFPVFTVAFSNCYNRKAFPILAQVVLRWPSKLKVMRSNSFGAEMHKVTNKLMSLIIVGLTHPSVGRHVHLSF